MVWQVRNLTHRRVLSCSCGLDSLYFRSSSGQPRASPSGRCSVRAVGARLAGSTSEWSWVTCPLSERPLRLLKLSDSKLPPKPHQDCPAQVEVKGWLCPAGIETDSPAWSVPVPECVFSECHLVSFSISSTMSSLHTNEPVSCSSMST
jgi:hypothetical protein